MVSLVDDLLAASLDTGALGSCDADELAPVQPRHEPVHVLLADDDELSQKVVSTLLDKSEYTGAATPGRRRARPRSRTKHVGRDAARRHAGWLSSARTLDCGSYSAHGGASRLERAPRARFGSLLPRFELRQRSRPL